MASPTIIDSQIDFAFSPGNPNPWTINYSGTLLAGDILFVSVATDAGPYVTGITNADLTFTLLAQDASMATFYATAASMVVNPALIATFTSSSYSNNAAISVQVRGAIAFDANGSLPAVTSASTPPTAVYSTTSPDDLVLFFIGATVGKTQLTPWTEPPPDSVDNSFGWVNGVNNTGGFSAVSICCWAKTLSGTATNDTAASSTITTGGVYMVTALVGSDAPGVPIDMACGPSTTTSITPQWAAGPGGTPDSYTLQYRLAGSSDPFTVIGGILALAETIGGLSPGIGYEWQVQAINSAGASAFSALTICTTLSTGAQVSVADLYFTSLGSFEDLSIDVNRRRFISSTGGARYLGQNGSGAFGATPVVFLTVTGGGAADTADTFAANNGNGGAFAETNGPLTLSVSSPPGSSVSAPAGSNVVGDYRNGQLYVFNLDQPLDADVQRRWLRSFRATPQPSKMPRRFDCLTVDMETGAQVPQSEPPLGPLVVLRWSDDGGHTWSNEMFRNAGPPGATAQRVMFKRLGATRRGQGLDRIFELSSTDEFKVAIIGAEIDP